MKKHVDSIGGKDLIFVLLVIPIENGDKAKITILSIN